MVSVDAKHDVYFNIPSPSLISLVVSVDVISTMFTLTPLPPSLLSFVVYVDVKHHVYL